jgi:malonate-semialdehyde dehydrogenase (acetylating)/methylmalonate-semialdehyde dehydrogenase
MASTIVPQSESTKPLPFFAGGCWHDSRSKRFGAVYNPSSGKQIASVPLCSADEASATVAAARSAFPDWAETPVVDRARFMFSFHALMDENFDELAALVTREHGKTIAEAKAEMKRGLEIVEFCCGIPSLIMGQTLPNIAAEVDGETNRHPLGVCVGITPFNFPSMVPMWMFPVAIVCGNTFVLKPSEKVPLSAIRLAELLAESGLPDGVFNIVHGDKEVVDALITHPDVAAVSFVGSTTVARAIYETGTTHGKRVQAAGGAKNHLVIMPDADVDLAVKAMAASAFGCTGQRCMAGSLALTVGPVGDQLVEQLCTYSKSMNVGPTDGRPETEMGPVINPDAVHRIAGYLDVAQQEGATVALDGRRGFDSDGFLIGPSVVDQVKPEMRLAKEEVFGPLLSVIRTADLDEAIAVGRNCPYGNGASIFTNNGHAAREFKRRFNAGMIGINVGVPAPMAWLPFTGWNESFFGDLHIQGTEGIHFYTQQKMTLTRWFKSSTDSHEDPVWAGKK